MQEDLRQLFLKKMNVTSSYNKNIMKNLTLKKWSWKELSNAQCNDAHNLIMSWTLSACLFVSHVPPLSPAESGPDAP
jgi:hypothetical protein